MKSFPGPMPSPVLCVAFLVPVHTIASAYLDLGTGSLIIQVLIGGVAGGLVALRLFWKQVSSFFTRWFNKSRRTHDTE